MTAATASMPAKVWARRVPGFVAVWLAVSAGWLVVLCVESLLNPPVAMLVFLVQAAIGGGVIAAARRSRSATRVFRLAMAACVLLGVTTTAVFALVGGSGDFLAFMLLALYLAAALFFMWGWRAELFLLGATVIPWAAAIPALAFHVPTVELVSAIVTGSAICLAIAEGGARNLSLALRQRLRQEESRRELEASRDAYRDLAEHAQELIFSTDLAGRFTYVNAALAHQLGEPAETLLGRSIHEFFDGPPLLDVAVDPPAMPPLVELEARTVHGHRWLEAAPSAIRDPAAGYSGVRAICRDVTERKQLERERDARIVGEHTARIEAERAREQAEAATRARDEFLATLSHELRSPLGIVLTWTRMLRDGLLDAKRTRHALERIEEAAQAQTRLVSDLLDVSRIAAGKVELELESVDLSALLTARIEAVRATAAPKKITVELRHEVALGPVLGDATRLRQLFDNLLLNAVKFTPEGGRVVVTLEWAQGDAQVTVTDTGIGIAPDVLPHVFDEFWQADSSITRRYGGLGLGLAIARRLVELHGGRIEAESPGPGHGTTFRVRLPLASTPPVAVRAAWRGASHHAALPGLEHVRVLVVDDEPNGRELLTTLLAGCGADVRAASSVREALERIDAGALDVLVADIAMPDEDGYKLIREIRARGARIVAIAVTALASAEDRAHALAEGYDAHLSKPVDPAELVATVARSAHSR